MTDIAIKVTRTRTVGVHDFAPSVFALVRGWPYGLLAGLGAVRFIAKAIFYMQLLRTFVNHRASNS
jgi:thiamine transporter ThiT